MIKMLILLTLISASLLTARFYEDEVSYGYSTKESEQDAIDLCREKFLLDAVASSITYVFKDLSRHSEEHTVNNNSELKELFYKRMQTLSVGVATDVKVIKKAEFDYDKRLVKMTFSCEINEEMMAELLKNEISGGQTRIEFTQGRYKQEISNNGSKPAEETFKVKDGHPSVKSEASDGFVFVEGGTFQMGSNDGESDEKPIHSVTLSSFYIGKYEVTVGDFREFVNASGYRTEAETGDGSRVYTTKWLKRSDVNWKNTYFSQTDKDPVTCISWNDAQAYIKWLNNKTGKRYRLPTEAEWEYAARGGNKSSGYKYSGSDNLGSVAWCLENSSSTTHPVGTKQANELGIYDMTGNVREWCLDLYGDKYYIHSPSTDPQGASSGLNRVNRGGSWFANATSCCITDRSCYTPDYHISNIGFRLALTP